MVVGEEGLLRELREAGLDAHHAAEAMPAAPAAVVVGMDRAFSYKALSAAQNAIRDGALYVATNNDATFPPPMGSCPGPAPWWRR